ncbi:MAG: hypothetical protein ACSLFI_01925 [Solirubrobacterales bacterium]
MEIAIPETGEERSDAADALTRYGNDNRVEVNLTELEAESL